MPQFLLHKRSPVSAVSISPTRGSVSRPWSMAPSPCTQAPCKDRKTGQGDPNEATAWPAVPENLPAPVSVTCPALSHRR